MRRSRAVSRRRRSSAKTRVFLHEIEKRLLVDHRDLGRLARDCGRATRGPIYQRHLAEGAVGADVLEHGAAREDADLARAHDVHALAWIILHEDLGVRLEALQREAAARQKLEIEGRLGHFLFRSHVPVPCSGSMARSCARTRRLSL